MKEGWTNPHGGVRSVTDPLRWQMNGVSLRILRPLVTETGSRSARRELARLVSSRSAVESRLATRGYVSAMPPPETVSGGR